MNTIAFVAAMIILGLVVFSKIPGLEHLVRPVIDLVFTVIKVVAANSASWSIWLIKLLSSAHIEVFKHLTASPEKLDPSYEVRKKLGED